MGVTDTDNQRVVMKEKIKKFSRRSQPHIDRGFCPTGKILAPTLDRWGMFCLFNLAYHDVMRFGELRKSIAGISARMLSVTLKRLEMNGMVERRAYSEVPPRVEYALTSFGLELSRRILDLSAWFLEQYEEGEVIKAE